MTEEQGEARRNNNNKKKQTRRRGAEEEEDAELFDMQSSTKKADMKIERSPSPNLPGRDVYRTPFCVFLQKGCTQIVSADRYAAEFSSPELIV